MTDGRVARWMLGAAGLAAALVIGRWTGEPTAGAVPAREPPPESSFHMTTADRAVMSREIRAAVVAAMPPAAPARARGGVAGVLDSPEPVSHGGSPDDAPALIEPTSEMRAADTAARRLVDDAVTRSAWSTADWRALEDLALQLAPDQRLEAYRRLAMAVNNRQIASLAPPVAQ